MEKKYKISTLNSLKEVFEWVDKEESISGKEAHFVETMSRIHPDKITFTFTAIIK